MKTARGLLALLLCAGIVSSSVEPALAQVRVESVQPAGAQAASLVAAPHAGISAREFGGASGSSFMTPAPALAAPSWSAASLPAAPVQALAAHPAAALAASPVLPDAAGNASEAAVPVSEFRRTVGSLETLARPAAPDSPPADRDGTVFFDQAKESGSSALAVAGSARERNPRLRPRDARAAIAAFGRKWGLPLTGASLVALGPLAGGAAAAGIDPHSASFELWSNVAKGVAMAVPLVVIGGWGLFNRYRAKEADAAKARFARAPLHKPVQPQLKHFLTNMTLAAIGIAAIAVIAGPYISTFNNFIDSHSIGILHWLGVKGWANVAASMVILDFMDWCMHYASHKYSWLWRLHKVHHTDLDYDLSTTYRMHPFETAVIMLFGLVEFAIVGPNLLAMAIGDLVAIVMGQYQHANITMPDWIENFLSKFFMTSHKHYIHHSMAPDEYDSNYGHIFSFWDRLLGTFKNFAPAYLNGKVKPGIREYPNPQELTVVKLLLMPFQKESARTAKSSEEDKPLIR